MKIEITTVPYRLNFRYPFRIAHGMRTGTDVVYVRAMCGGFSGFGEATLPPYLPDNVENTVSFFRDTYFDTLTFPCSPQEINAGVEEMFEGNYPAKAALDMALWQLKSRIENKPLQELLKVPSEGEVPHSYTLGIGSKREMAEKITLALMEGFEFFKLKLDGVEDNRIIEDYSLLTRKPFAVDANQAWNNMDQVQKTLELLEQNRCVLIEQPFRKEDRSFTALLRDKTKIPILADEACQVPNDIEKLSSVFDGINIKLQKCGGISPALKMISKARELKMKILIGCMSESSVGCNAAEVLAPMCDWADLDGPWLIDNDPVVETLFEPGIVI